MDGIGHNGEKREFAHLAEAELRLSRVADALFTQSRVLNLRVLPNTLPP